MTPKEQAKDLYDKMYSHLPSYAKISARECALEAITVIMECVQGEDDYKHNPEYTSSHPKYTAYWKLVQEELLKL